MIEVINQPQFKNNDKVRFLKRDDGFYNPIRKNSIGVIESVGKIDVPYNHSYCIKYNISKFNLINYVYWIKFKDTYHHVYEYQLELVKDKSNDK